MSDNQFLEQLEQTLSVILSPDSKAIKQATEQLKKQFYPNTGALPALIHILQNSGMMVLSS